jgi:hypothetical protein
MGDSAGSSPARCFFSIQLITSIIIKIMSFRHQVIKERFDLLITSDEQTFKGEFELDKGSRFLLGISVTSDREDLLFHRGSFRMQLSDKELFPEKFEAKLLMAGLNVAPDQRMVTLGELPTGNGKLDVSYLDTDHSQAAFSPYRLTIYAYSVSSIEHEG